MKTLQAQSVFLLSSWDVNELMEQAFGVKNFNCSLGASKETSSNVGQVKKGSYLYSEEETKGYVARKSCDFDQVVFILHALCEKDLIPEGNYIVDHSW